ncbi:MAG: helix-turn-helix domain-containing protein [Chloroflexi bacterium]|nr:helix-turn-helix domain-containing protein [Chloroflexota bacterium]
MEQDGILSVRQVAEYLQLKASTVYTWAQEGKIPATKVGRSWKFTSEDIERWLEQHLTDAEGG